MKILLIGVGATGGVLFAILMPYMPTPGWTLSIIFCYAMGSVAFFNLWLSRKENKDKQQRAQKAETSTPPLPVEEKITEIKRNETAFEVDATESSGQSTEFPTMNMDDEVRCALELINRDYEQAKRMAMGEEFPPSNVREAVMYEAVKIRALLNGDVVTLHQLVSESKVTRPADRKGGWREFEVEKALKAAQVGAEQKTDRKPEQEVQTEIESLREDLEGIDKAIAEYNEYMVESQSRDPEHTIDELIIQWSRKESTSCGTPEP
jgi:hypothetical protein